MLAIIWLKIVTKRYDKFCHKISPNSLPLKTDSVDLIFQHRLRLGSLYFFNKKSVILIFYLDLYKIYSRLRLLAYNSGTKTHVADANIRLCTYPLLTLVLSLSSIALMAIILKQFVHSTLYGVFSLT